MLKIYQQQNLALKNFKMAKDVSNMKNDIKINLLETEKAKVKNEKEILTKEATQIEVEISEEQAKHKEERNSIKCKVGATVDRDYYQNRKYNDKIHDKKMNKKNKLLNSKYEEIQSFEEKLSDLTNEIKKLIKQNEINKDKVNEVCKNEALFFPNI